MFVRLFVRSFVLSFVFSFVRLVGWSVGRSVGQSVGRSVGRSVSRSVSHVKPASHSLEASEARPETSLKSDPANKEFWSKCRQETSEIMNAHPKMQGGLRVRAHNASLPAPRGGHPRP